MNRHVLKARHNIVNEIFQKMDEDPTKYIHFIYKETLRYLINKFSNLSYIDGKNSITKIKCQHAHPERAIGMIFKDANVILPFITISENSTAGFDKKQRYSSVLVDQKYWYPKLQRAIRIVSLPPRPVSISYSLNIWSFYKNDLDQVREILFSMFNPDLNITVENNLFFKAFIESEEDDSEIKVSDKEDRVLQKSLNLTVETFMPSPKFLYTSTGKIEKINFELDVTTGKITEATALDIETVLTRTTETDVGIGTGAGTMIPEHSHEQYVTPEELQSMTWLTN